MSSVSTLPRPQTSRDGSPAAPRGRVPPPYVIEASRRAHLGRRASKETRRKLSEAQRRRGAWPPAAGKPWTREEDALVTTLSSKEAATRLPGRTLTAVYSRRRMLGLRDGRKRPQRSRGMRIGELRFVDESIRPVYADNGGRQYVMDDQGTKIYGAWLVNAEPVADAPITFLKPTN